MVPHHLAEAVLSALPSFVPESDMSCVLTLKLYAGLYCTDPYVKRWNVADGTSEWSGRLSQKSFRRCRQPGQCIASDMQAWWLLAHEK